MGCGRLVTHSTDLCGSQNCLQKPQSITSGFWKETSGCFSKTRSGFLRLLQVVLQSTEASRVDHYPSVIQKRSPHTPGE